MPSFTLSEYCNDPSEVPVWNQQLSNSQIQQYQAICNALKNVEQKSPEYNPKETIGTKIFQTLLHALGQTLIGVFALKGLGVFKNFLGPKLIQNIANVFSNINLDDPMFPWQKGWKFGAGFAKPWALTEEGGAWFAEAGLNPFLEGAAKLASIVADLITQAINFTIKSAVALLDITDPLQWPMLIVFIIGLILDSIDPCDLKSQMNLDALKIFNTSFNRVVRETRMKSYNAVQISTGQTIFVTMWPLDYYADPIISDFSISGNTDLVTNSRAQEEQEVRNLYLLSLSVNSNGQQILYPLLEDPGVVKDNKFLTNVLRQVGASLGNNNTVATNWITKWLPIIIGVIIILVIVLLIIK